MYEHLEIDGVTTLVKSSNLRKGPRHRNVPAGAQSTSELNAVYAACLCYQ